jgi:hypothetical protein
MSVLNKTEISLQKKLQQLANGEDIELNKSEADLYGIDVADHLPEVDLIEEEGE